MLFKKTYSFQFPKNKDVLTRELKELAKTDLVQKNGFGSDTFYSVEFNWDEFVVTQRAKMFERSNYTEDAHIRLSPLTEDLTQVDVKIKYSEVTWLFLIFLQLGITAGCLFGNEFHWLLRIALLTGATGAWGSIIHLGLISGAKTLKEIVEQLFERVEEQEPGCD